MTTNQAFTILSNAGGVRAARIITDNIKNLNRIKVWRMARALRKNVPVAKIVHQKWFWGLKFYTNKKTLDPRPDTETLVATVISDCPDNSERYILDLGTGTGCVLASLIKSIPNSTGVGLEKSFGARRVARKNVRDLGLNNLVKICNGNFYARHTVPDTTFDIIVSNPPYIAKNDSRVDCGALHDPKSALFADNNGLGAYMAIARNAKHWIKNSGKIYLEIGINQESLVKKIFTDNGWIYIKTELDLASIPRVLVFQYV